MEPRLENLRLLNAPTPSYDVTWAGVERGHHFGYTTPRASWPAILLAGWPTLSPEEFGVRWLLNINRYQIIGLRPIGQYQDAVNGLVTVCACDHFLEPMESFGATPCLTRQHLPVPATSPSTPKSPTSPFWRHPINWLWKHLRFN